MLLALFMAKYLSFKDVGIFSLLVGLTSMLPGAAGLGLTYFVNRNLIGSSPVAVRQLARDRLIVTAACGIIAGAGVFLLRQSGRIELPLNPLVCAALIVTEMVGFDLHMMLIARHRAAVANFLLFVRSASWIPAFMLTAFLAPSFRNVHQVANFWLAGAVAGVLATVFVLRHIVFDEKFYRAPFEIQQIKSLFPRNMPIWVSDFSSAVGQNIDKFIISGIIGNEAAGIYYFYYSISNAAFIVCQSMTTQPYMPILRKIYNNEEKINFENGVKSMFLKTFFVSVPFFVMAVIGTYILVHIIGRKELIENDSIIIIITVGMAFKIIFDFFNTVDYVLEKDGTVFGMNIAFLLATVAVVSAMSWTLGLHGAAMGFCGTMAVFALLRWILWRRWRHMA